MSDERNDQPITRADFFKMRRGRNIAIGLALAAFMVLVFIVTIVKMSINSGGAG